MNVGALRVLAVQDVAITASLRHVEIYTMTGLVTLLWHGPDDAERVVICGGGAMGGLLGPANGFYHDLGDELGAEGYGVIRVGYRAPNDLGTCIADMAAAAMLGERQGASKFVSVGHSFGGAVALGLALEPSPVAESVVGVVALSTQSAGWEDAAGLHRRPLLLVHGDTDTILPHWSSEVANELAGGHGRLEIRPGAGHLLAENGCALWLRENVPSWIRSTLGS